MEVQECDFEILIATMQRSNLDFLDAMFPDNEVHKYHILIINQTDGSVGLTSNSKLIRIINSDEVGLAKSRNLALKNAIGRICLIADDDVHYVKGFKDSIVKAYEKWPNAALITFKIEALEGGSFKPYPVKNKRIDKIGGLENISSIEMTFNRSVIMNKNIKFNELFGLGSKFACGEEFVFGKDIFEAGFEIYYFNKVIVKHKLERSTTDLGADHLMYAKGALKYLKNKYLSPLMYVNMMLFLVTNNFITIWQIPSKLFLTFKGRKDYINGLK